MAGLKAQFLQVVVAGFQIVERRFGFIVLNKIMLDSAFAGLREDALEVHLALPRIDKVSWF